MANLYKPSLQPRNSRLLPYKHFILFLCCPSRCKQTTFIFPLRLSSSNNSRQKSYQPNPDSCATVSSPVKPADVCLPLFAVAAADNPSSAGPIVDPTVTSATPASAAAEDIMIFSDFYKGSRSPLARLRNGNPQLPAKPPTASPDWVGDEYTDLLSKDKAKNKEAVRRYLADKVRYDWAFDWPAQQIANNPEKHPQREEDQSVCVEPAKEDDCVVKTPATSDASNDGYQVDESDPDSDDESVYSVVSEDNIHWRPRAEWTSDIE